MSRIMPEASGVPLGGALEIEWDERRIAIEHAWIDGPARAPLVVFLHEGLGCVAMWRDFPAALCRAIGTRGFVFSRPGYGRSTGPTERNRDVDYLHRQAHEVLPQVLDAAGIDEPIVLFGHSDGGTIALLFAARFPDRPRAVIAVAPHIFVEDVTVEGVRRVRDAYANGPVRPGLARHHDDADAVFRAWTDIWLDPRFRGWNIERDIATIRCPVLAIQGHDDEFATLDQVNGIARAVPGTRVVAIGFSGHSPQRDQPAEVIEAMRAFMETL
jgi:pimeloyl-ACP methyl ester carboxylesterase